MLVSLTKRKRPDNRPTFSYANPIYSYDDNNNVAVEENEDNDNTLYDDVAVSNGTSYYNDVDPQHIVNAEEQKNRYKLGLDPLPKYMSPTSSEI
tara:strand:- start:2277 stop:2558 length:282 start_codon:yes stop_codon:yes gene_type:complete